MQSVFNSRMRILLVTCFAWAVSGTQLSTLAAHHWDDWIYTKEAHHWHSLWCRSQRARRLTQPRWSASSPH